MDRLDDWITGGRYDQSFLLVTCPKCEENTPVTAETEYGMTTWDPMECKHCGAEFTGDEEWEEDGPDEDLVYECMVDEQADTLPDEGYHL